MRPRTIVFGMNTLFAGRQFLPEILDRLQQSGFHVVVIAPEDGTRDHGLGPGVEFRSIALRREISPLSDLRALFRIWRILRSIRPAITNMSTPKMALIGGVAAWMARVPNRIYTLRGLRYETTDSWKRGLLLACERLACACAHRVICISRSVKEAAERQGVVPPAKATLLGDRVSEGVSLASRPSHLPAGLDLRRGIPVIGFAGRLTRDKGIHELVAAFRILRAAGVRTRLLLLGDFEAGDPVDPAVAHFIRTDPDVDWLGHVPSATPYYPWMDVFAFPTHREGLGRVLLEAAAAGKPVVSTRVTGVIDVVADGVTGILVAPGHALALARATQWLIQNPQLASRMGARARRLVEEQFDNTIYLDRLAALLNAPPGDAATHVCAPPPAKSMPRSAGPPAVYPHRRSDPA